MSVDLSPYDALLLVSFGGPERPEDVVPFLENVTRGRGIPRERLAEVGQHYFDFGGRSPINDQNRALLAAIRADFATAGLDIPVYWGNRNWDPYLGEVVEQMARDGVRRAACFVTSAYASYSGCRQYRENLAEASREAAGEGRLVELDRLRQYFNHPGFVETMIDSTISALSAISEANREGARLVFVTHSIPLAMNDASGPAGGAYVEQHESLADLVVEGVFAATGRRHAYDLVYCSRSGSPRTPWLEPDVNDHLEALTAAGTKAVAVVPIGFISDHMEVIYDLDTEASHTAQDLGLEFVRAATAGVDPRFVAMVRDLLLERVSSERALDSGARDRVERKSLGDLPATWDRCAIGCCANASAPLPVIGEAR